MRGLPFISRHRGIRLGGRRRHFRMRLTAVGLVFAVAFGLTFAAALNTGINLLYMLAAALMSFMLVSWWVTMMSLRRMRLSVALPRAAHREQETAVTLNIENTKRLMPAASVRVESSNAQGQAVGYLPLLGGRQVARLRVRETFPKRGDYPSPAYTIVTSFPFGIVEAWRTIQPEGRILVYPRVNPLRTSAAEQTSGARYRARTVAGDGDEFFSLREYQPGDDIRRISWRLSARMGKIMVRELARQNARFVIFLLDTRRSPNEAPDFEDRFEEAVELVASLGVTLLDRQYNVAVETPQGVLNPGEGTGQKRRLLDFLARVAPAPREEYPVFDEYHCKLDTHVAALLMVSPDPAQWGRREAGGLRVLDPREVIHA
jgi:uncharacterized protein (DUF58 family)